MSDLTSFGNAGFSAKNYINEAIQSRDPSSSLESFLVELEMKLQLHAEDLELSLEQVCIHACRFRSNAAGVLY